MRTSYYIALALLCLAACSSEDDTIIPIDKSYSDPYEDLAVFREKIGAAEHGWRGELHLKAGGMYTLFMELKSNGDVSMVIDVTGQTAEAAGTSKYTIEITEEVNASLLFKEGSYLEALSEAGETKYDKSFAYKGSTPQGDTIALLGNSFGDELTLVRATADEKSRYIGGDLSIPMAAIPDYLEAGNFFFSEPGADKIIQFEMNTDIRQVLFTFVEDQAHVVGFDFAYTPDGIRLNHSLNLYGETISELYWDDVNDQLYFEWHGIRYDFQAASLPAIPLHYLLGTEYPYDLSLQSPSLDEVPGWSTAFKTAWMADETALLNNSEIELFYVDFDFTPTGALNLKVYFGEGGKLKLVQLPYTFEKTETGLYTFIPGPIDDSTPAGEKAEEIRQGLPTLLGLFEGDTFSIQFHTLDPSYGLLARFESQEHPEMYCTAFFY
jgi:hypothetical protein